MAEGPSAVSTPEASAGVPEASSGSPVTLPSSKSSPAMAPAASQASDDESGASSANGFLGVVFGLGLWVCSLMAMH